MTRRGMQSLLALLLFVSCAVRAQEHRLHAYLGFDRNDYPGDAALPVLRQTFRYTGYWLNPPSGERQNTWTGKRTILKKYGFGFLLLFNGRTYAALKGKDAAALGAADGQAAAASALREGFPSGALIFLDQEEGGRLLPEQAAYLFAWIDSVRASGERAGIYCSGIGGSGNSISTAADIAHREASRAQQSPHSQPAPPLALWVANDQCPPSPGCTLSPPPLSASFTPAAAALTKVWQYAQSPRRRQFSAACPANQAPDGNCYAPGTNIFVDLNTASSPDPSEMP